MVRVAGDGGGGGGGGGGGDNGVVTLQANSQVTTESEKIFTDQAIAQDCEDYEH